MSSVEFELVRKRVRAQASVFIAFRLLNHIRSICSFTFPAFCLNECWFLLLRNMNVQVVRVCFAQNCTTCPNYAVLLRDVITTPLYACGRGDVQRPCSVCDIAWCYPLSLNKTDAHLHLTIQDVCLGSWETISQGCPRLLTRNLGASNYWNHAEEVRWLCWAAASHYTWVPSESRENMGHNRSAWQKGVQAVTHTRKHRITVRTYHKNRPSSR